MLTDDDLLTPERQVNPYPFFAMMRDEDPIHWSERYNAWFFFKHSDVWDALRDPRFSSDRVMRVYDQKLTPEQQEKRRPTFDILRHWMVFQDPPEHTRLRRLVANAFSPRSVRAWRPVIEEVVGGLLIELERGPNEVDLIEQYAYPIPAVVIAKMMGVPPEDRDLFKDWSDDVLKLVFGAPGVADRRAKAQEGLIELAGYLKGLMHSPAVNKEENLISQLMSIKEGDDSLTEDEVISTLVLLLFGGHETTTSLIGTGTRNLLLHPEQLALLINNPGLLPSAVEELLRYDGPAKAEMRWVTDEVHMGGKIIPPDTAAYLVGSSANHDPDEFENPEQLNIERVAGRHVGFGFGLHTCLGAAIARLEGSIAIDALLRKFPDMALAGGEQWHPTMLSRGMTSLPVTIR
jgi:hypothetical protein